ncbi:Hypothetical protein SMAX5B_001312 [Scophthalmus maximus]|uniref:Uncharacterized protein n=1 Tax=Scophthalmus maximus TaxID=52904 RepID=A0A2U9BL24_SCOMX|nr:Hypothetical protein SMAX5B_001312 [Scophthalmus maximus]
MSVAPSGREGEMPTRRVMTVFQAASTSTLLGPCALSCDHPVLPERMENLDRVLSPSPDLPTCGLVSLFLLFSVLEFLMGTYLT